MKLTPLGFGVDRCCSKALRVASLQVTDLSIEGKPRMGRQHSLFKKVEHVLAQDRQYSYRTRQEHRRIVRQCFADWAKLRLLPYRLDQLTRDHFVELVAYYRQQGNNDSTLKNKLGALRHFIALAELTVSIPSNAELGIQRDECIRPQPVVPTPSLCHPITQVLVALQQRFGVTRFEAIKVLLSFIQTTKQLLWIDRTLAHNHKTRQIPIVTSEQKACLQQCKELQARYSLEYTPELVTYCNRLYQAELGILKLNPRLPYRQHYAQQRYQALCRQDESDQAIQTLCHEMGCHSTHRIKKEYLHELTTA